MSNSIKETLTKAINYLNDASTISKPQRPIKPEVWKMKSDNQASKSTGNQTTNQKAVEPVLLYKSIPPANQDEMVSQERLREAIIWSEILGKPLSKRRKRRI